MTLHTDLQCQKLNIDQWWGLLSLFPPFRYFPKFSAFAKRTLTVRYRVYIWQVSPQLSCGGTCQIWMWFKESNIYFCEIENFAYEEINEQSFSNPHPRLQTYKRHPIVHHPGKVSGVCKMVAILSRPQCVNSLLPGDATCHLRSWSSLAQNDIFKMVITFSMNHWVKLGSELLTLKGFDKKLLTECFSMIGWC